MILFKLDKIVPEYCFTERHIRSFKLEMAHELGRFVANQIGYKEEGFGAGSRIKLEFMMTDPAKYAKFKERLGELIHPNDSLFSAIRDLLHDLESEDQ